MSDDFDSMDDTPPRSLDEAIVMGLCIGKLSNVSENIYDYVREYLSVTIANEIVAAEGDKDLQDRFAALFNKLVKR